MVTGNHEKSLWRFASALPRSSSITYTIKLTSDSENPIPLANRGSTHYACDSSDTLIEAEGIPWELLRIIFTASSLDVVEITKQYTLECQKPVMQRPLHHLDHSRTAPSQLPNQSYFSAFLQVNTSYFTLLFISISLIAKSASIQAWSWHLCHVLG